MTDAPVLAWGERGFRYARVQGWDVPTAEDIRQAMMLDYLEHEGTGLKFHYAYLHAQRRCGYPWRRRQRVPLPPTHGYVPPTEAQLDASAYLARLPKGDAHVLRRWLAGYEPRDVRRTDHAAKRRAWARERILTALRDALEETA